MKIATILTTALSEGEAHSGLADYCSLAIEPSSSENGHPQGGIWQDLYPGLFARPDLN
jgi:hypothetical protein